MDSPASEPQQTSSATVSQASEGWLRVPEGSIYWRLDVSTGNDATDRPTILLIHAAVADHTMWDAQVEFLVSKGWNCLRWDLFGYGVSFGRQPTERSFRRLSAVLQVKLIPKVEKLAKRRLLAQSIQKSFRRRRTN